MRPRRAFVLCLTVLVLLPLCAYAQTSGGDGSLPPVSLPIAVTTIVSILLGLLNMVAQGSILNLVTVPKTWAGPATAVATFLTGSLSFLSTASQPWSGSIAFYAFAYGLFGLFGGSLPAFAIHAHVTLPKTIRAMRAPAAVAGLVLVGALCLGDMEACTPATQATISDVDKTIENDLAEGKSLDAIKADVNAILGKPGLDLETIVMDGIALVLDLGKLPLNRVTYAEAMRDDLRAAHGLPVPTKVLRASPAPASS